MTRVLTVDDSRAIRSMVTKQVAELGFDTDEAENGLEGLDRLAECQYDLVVLDVTMPELDGPGMLAKMRERGDRTPVLMLTSESKTSIVASAMKGGIEDYVLKPFKPDDLRAKILKALKVAAPANAAPPAPMMAPAPIAPAQPQMHAVSMVGTGEAARQFIDVLVIDDMENVHKKLRVALPAHVSMQGSSSGQAALSLCRNAAFRVILVDADMPDVDSRALLAQLKLLQPMAAFLALYLRSTSDPLLEARGAGFDGVLLKPFDPDAIDELMQQYFDKQDVLDLTDNVFRALPFTGKEDRRDRYFKRLGSLAGDGIPKVAAACFDDLVLDLSNVPVDPKHLPYLVIAVEERARKEGLGLRLVGSSEIKQVLSGFTETASVPLFDSVDRACGA